MAYTAPPSLADLERLAADAFATIPPGLAQHVEGVAIRVVDFPDEETIEEMGLGNAFDLLGLYRGVSLDQKSVTATAHDVDLIFLYRRPLLDFWCETGEDLSGLIRHVLVHEIGHHFGFSDEDMEALEAQAETEG